MKKIMISLLCTVLIFVFVACGDSQDSEISSQSATDASSETGSPIASSDEAIQLVKTLVGNENDKYIFEFDNEDKILKDDNGDFYINRDIESSTDGLECFIIRVYTETKDGDNISQDNIGWYFVSKSNSKVFEITDPYETKLKAIN